MLRRPAGTFSAAGPVDVEDRYGALALDFRAAPPLRCRELRETRDVRRARDQVQIGRRADRCVKIRIILFEGHDTGGSRNAANTDDGARRAPRLDRLRERRYRFERFGRRLGNESDEQHERARRRAEHVGRKPVPASRCNCCYRHQRPEQHRHAEDLDLRTDDRRRALETIRVDENGDRNAEPRDEQRDRERGADRPLPVNGIRDALKKTSGTTIQISASRSSEPSRMRAEAIALHAATGTNAIHGKKPKIKTGA